MNEPTNKPEQNGNVAPSPERGSLVQPCAMAFAVEHAGMGTLQDGSVTKMVRLRFEHGTGTTDLIFPVVFGTQIAQALLKACSGIEIARGTPPSHN